MRLSQKFLILEKLLSDLSLYRVLPRLWIGLRGLLSVRRDSRKCKINDFSVSVSDSDFFLKNF